MFFYSSTSYTLTVLYSAGTTKAKILFNVFVVLVICNVLQNTAKKNDQKEAERPEEEGKWFWFFRRFEDTAPTSGLQRPCII